MDKEVYQVPRNDYTGFVAQIKPEARIMQKDYNETHHIIRVKSKKTNKVLCERYISQVDTEPDYYYVYEMPDDDERQPARPVERITLHTVEEAQNFFKILSKLMKKSDDRAVQQSE